MNGGVNETPGGTGQIPPPGVGIMRTAGGHRQSCLFTSSANEIEYRQMKMKRTTGTLITIGALALSQLTAPAAVIYDNLGSIEPSDGLEVFSAYSTFPAKPVAMSFTVGNTGGTLTSVVVGLGGGSGNGFRLELYSAGSGVPLSLLGGLSGESDPPLPASYTYLPTAPTSLAANTTYFIVASAGVWE